MPFKSYTASAKAEALEVIAQHGADIQAARIELSQRWGHAPSPSTLAMWIADAQGQNTVGKGNVHQCNGALKPFEGTDPGAPWQKLMEAVAGLGSDPECTVIILSRISL